MFLVVAAILNRGQTVGKIERGPPNYHLGQIWLKLVQRFQRRRCKCDILLKYALFA